MIKWKVYKSMKRHKIIIHNLMDFFHWKNAIKFTQENSQKRNPEIQLALTYPEQISLRLENLQSDNILEITRR